MNVENCVVKIMKNEIKLLMIFGACLLVLGTVVFCQNAIAQKTAPILFRRGLETPILISLVMGLSGILIMIVALVINGQNKSKQS